LQRSVIQPDRRLDLAALIKGQSEAGAGQGDVRIQFERPPVTGDGFFRLPQALVGNPQVDMNSSDVGIRLDGLAVTICLLLKIAALATGQSAVVQLQSQAVFRVCEMRLDRQRTTKTCNRLFTL